MNSYLRFNETLSISGKTKVVEVYSVRSGDLLGTISWMGRWRCYAFYPQFRTAWNVDCLHEVNEKIRELMNARTVQSA